MENDHSYPKTPSVRQHLSAKCHRGALAAGSRKRLVFNFGGRNVLPLRVVAVAMCENQIMIPFDVNINSPSVAHI